MSGFNIGNILFSGAEILPKLPLGDPNTVLKD